ncbi:MAG: UDP-N-acetylmuramoyl-tripeptide--D-alanyl-D-alanine ligase [Mediterranea sp.]|jgi:UDP-N-acetylmuramoyl-tripeptide--D-alanyl-D-alanine ligase|nr:UDP-N-acetylmuramoyl-tripeptide--D-alanyl-D-alanine ligase [Mediterranea sp.]
MELSALYQIFLECGSVTTDSRNCPPGALFIALKGESFDGNAYAAKALEHGCAYAVVDEAEHAVPGDGRYLLVDDGLRTLQRLATHHRRQVDPLVIAITGTNGKTTTKELVATVLTKRYPILYTQGNLNNHIGVPLTLLRLRQGDEFAVVEMGASHPGDIKLLCEIAEPNYGLITNVGKAHLEGFGSLDGVARAKGELYDYLRQDPEASIFIDMDNPRLRSMAGDLDTIGYGTHEGAKVRGHVVENSPFLAIQWAERHEDTLHQVRTRLVGGYNFANVLAAVTIGSYFAVAPEDIDDAIEAYVPGNSRSQLKRTADNTLIVDAYNANPTSMTAALRNFQSMDAPHKMVILGDMLELGRESAAEHQRVVDLLENSDFERVTLVGHEFAATRHSPNFVTYPDTASLIEALRADKPRGATLLLKGSHGIGLDAAVAAL